MSGPTEPSRTLRRGVLVAAVLRYLVPILAIPAIPALLAADRLPLLVLLRPTKEFLLLGGGLLRTQGEPSLGLLFIAYAPLMIGGAWVFFAVGRLYADELREGGGPRWLSRVVDPDTLLLAQRVLERRGPAIAVLGRIAALPPTIVAAAAGTSEVDARRYLVADLVGAVVAFALTVGAGVALGDAYERGGVWLTAAGLALLVGLIALLTRWIRREAALADVGAVDGESPGPDTDAAPGSTTG